MNNYQQGEDSLQKEKVAEQLEHTRPMPRVEPQVTGQSSSVANNNRVRELEPVRIGNNKYPQQNYAGGQPPMPPTPPNNMLGNRFPQQPEKHSKGKFAAILVVGFLVAMFMGILVSGYMADQQNKETALQTQSNQADKTLNETQREQSNLTKRKQQLETQQQDLLKKQKEAQSVLDNLKGKKQQLDKSQDTKSTAGKLLDKVTGDESKNKAAASQTDKETLDATQKVEAINQAVQDANQAIDEVDAQLNQLDNIRHDAMAAKDTVAKTYSENKDTIDKILYYISQGAGNLGSLLGK